MSEEQPQYATDENPEVNTGGEVTVMKRLAHLERLVEAQAAELATLRRDIPVIQGHLLTALGVTFHKQGTAIVEAAIPVTTTVKLAPQEEAINDATLKVIVEEDESLTLYAVKDNALIPYEHPQLDQDVIRQKFREHGFPTGTMVNMNIYIERGQS